MDKIEKEFLNENWQYVETANFIRYIHPINRKIDQNDLKKQEKRLSEFCSLFDIKLKQKIKIISVENRQEMKKFIGRETNGRAITKEWTVWSVYIYDPHEVAHILSNNFLGDPNNLLGEGIAVLFGWEEGWHGKSLDYWMRGFVKEKNYIPLKELCDDYKFKTDFDDDITYPESGAFVGFLINKYGIDKFKKIYKRVGWKKPVDETIKIFEGILGISLEDLEKQFISQYK